MWRAGKPALVTGILRRIGGRIRLARRGSGPAPADPAPWPGRMQAPTAHAAEILAGSPPPGGQDRPSARCQACPHRPRRRAAASRIWIAPQRLPELLTGGAQPDRSA
jgi:hypothetical protein